jgi:hypothetical protein
VIDPQTYEVKDYILVGQRPWHLELSPDQSKLLLEGDDPRARFFFAGRD